MAALGRENPCQRGAECGRDPALLDPMVGEARAHVQGESLKARAVFRWQASQLPDHQGDKPHGYSDGDRRHRYPQLSVVVLAYSRKGACSLSRGARDLQAHPD